MTKKEDKNRSEGRRKLLKKAGVSSGAVAASSLLPDNWVKPALKSIALPAHANTSAGGGGGGGAGTTMAPTTVAGTTVAGTTVAGTTVAGTTVAGTTVAGTTVAGTTIAGTTTVMPTTTAVPECMIVTAAMTDTGGNVHAPGTAIVVTDADVPNTDPSEFSMINATTENCPDGAEVELVLDLGGIQVTQTAVVTGEMAMWPATMAPFDFNAMAMTAGTATFTITDPAGAPLGTSSVVINLAWSAP